MALSSAERQKRYRAKRNVTESVTERNGEVVTAAARLAEQLGEAHAEIARLKKLLAEANQRAVEARRTTIDAVGVRMGGGRGKASLQVVEGAECIHGGVYGACRKLGCGAK